MKKASKTAKFTAKRQAHQEAIYRQYGRNKAGDPVPTLLVVRGGKERRRVEYLVKRLRGELELRAEDKNFAAAAIEAGLEGRSFDQAFGLSNPSHRPRHNRPFFQAVEYLLRRALGEPSDNAFAMVAERWSVGKTSVKAALTQNRRGAEAWIDRRLKQHFTTYTNIPVGSHLADRETGLRSLIIHVDHEIGPDDAPYLIRSTR